MTLSLYTANVTRQMTKQTMLPLVLTNYHTVHTHKSGVIIESKISKIITDMLVLVLVRWIIISAICNHKYIGDQSALYNVGIRSLISISAAHDHLNHPEWCINFRS